MDSSQDRERAIFLQALDLRENVDVSDFLAEACQGDMALLKSVKALLTEHGRTDDLLDLSQGIESGSALPLEQIGHYKIREKIGEGGMGIVYVAEQTEPVQRKVALKIIKPGMDTKEVIARFEAERQALAFMEHPNIARVLDAGTTNSRGSLRDPSVESSTGPEAHEGGNSNADALIGDYGRPYFVMELVRGIPITEYCDQGEGHAT